MTDSAFKRLWENIPESDQARLAEHGITDMTKLVANKAQLQKRELENVGYPVQTFLEVVCTYVQSLDSLSSFTWEGFENHCGFVDNSGENVFFDDDGVQTQTKKKKKVEEADPDGYNLTTEERKQMEQAVEDDPLTLKIRGFSPRSLQFEFDERSKKKEILDGSDKTTVAFNGSVYYVKKCYHYHQSSGESVVVGIRKFTKVRLNVCQICWSRSSFMSLTKPISLFFQLQNEKKAICALVVPFKETILGPKLEEVPPIGVPKTYEEAPDGLPDYVQVFERIGLEPIIPLSSLKPCTEPEQLPDLCFERQQAGEPPHNFGFVYEQDGSNRREERTEIRFVDYFAGSGGFHQGVTQVPGFKGAAAVEWWDTAW